MLQYKIPISSYLAYTILQYKIPSVSQHPTVQVYCIAIQFPAIQNSKLFASPLYCNIMLQYNFHQPSLAIQFTVLQYNVPAASPSLLVTIHLVYCNTISIPSSLSSLSYCNTISAIQSPLLKYKIFSPQYCLGSSPTHVTAPKKKKIFNIYYLFQPLEIPKKNTYTHFSFFFSFSLFHLFPATGKYLKNTCLHIFFFFSYIFFNTQINLQKFIFSMFFNFTTCKILENYSLSHNQINL